MKNIRQSDESSSESISEELLGDDLEIDTNVENLPL